MNIVFDVRLLYIASDSLNVLPHIDDIGIDIVSSPAIEPEASYRQRAGICVKLRMHSQMLW